MSAIPLVMPQLPATEDAPFSVMCIDDNVMLVDALEQRLMIEPGFTGMFRVQDFETAVEQALEHRPSIVLLDVDLPGGIDAFAILSELAKRAPDIRVAVFTGYPNGEMVMRSMAMGAWAYLSKGIGGEQLVQALRKVMAGEAVIDLDD